MQCQCVILHRFDIIADYCSNLVRKTATLHFLATYGATYAIHLRFIGKLIVDFPLIIVELFSLDVLVLSQSTRLPDGRTTILLSPYDKNTNVSHNIHYN